MPTREEIMRTLELAETLSLDGKMSDQFIGFAVQVATMRCETCKWSDEPVNETVLCMPLGARFNKNFGCFHHEPKEGE